MRAPFLTNFSICHLWNTLHRIFPRHIAGQSFAEAVEIALQEKAMRRPRTRAEFRNVCDRILRHTPSLADRKISRISREECGEIIRRVFPTARQQEKARRILHSLFEISIRYGKCVSNPIVGMARPQLCENEVRPLSWEHLRALLRTARKREFQSCMPPLGLMLWAGIRPAEVCRLRWSDIDWEENVITLRPQHSKTGGARHVTLQPVLARWLQESGMTREGKICPPNWERRWKRLRTIAGVLPWQQDVLRHTFASYHAKFWRNFPLLQTEMGHRSAELLRTRYLSMYGVTREHAIIFWRPGGL